MARPIEFEYDKVLEKAMQQFWKDGFEASSVQKLLDATEINRGTLYNSFGDKDTFFKLSLDRFNALIKADIDASLGNKELKALDSIQAFFKLSILEVTAKQRSKGCLLVNSVCESINWDKDIQKILRSSLNVVRKALLKRTKELEKAKLLKPKLKPEQAADFLLDLLQGMFVSARNGRSPKQLNDAYQLGLQAICK